MNYLGNCQNKNNIYCLVTRPQVGHTLWGLVINNRNFRLDSYHYISYDRVCFYNASDNQRVTLTTFCNPNCSMLFLISVANSNVCVSGRGSGVRELRGYQHSSLAEGRHRALPLQRLRPLLQDERTKQAADQAKTKIGECKNPTNLV